MIIYNRTILHVVHRLTVGGAERVLINYVNGSKTHQHIICSFLPADIIKDEIKNKNVKIINLDKKTGNDFRVPFQLSNICRIHKVDLIHCQGWGTYLEGLLCAKFLSLKTKFVFAFHGKTITDLGRIPKRRVLIQRLGAIIGNGIITPSDEMRTDYALTIGVPCRKITLIYNGVDTDYFAPTEFSSHAKHQFGFSDGDFVFGSVARMDPVKNFSSLLQAFAYIKAQGVQCKLLLVGDGPLLPELKNQAKALGVERETIFTGRRSDIPNCLHAMDCYVSPSFYEGFSMTILEAFSCGLPVIAYNVGGTKEMLSHGQNGLLLSPSNTLTDALIEMTSNQKMRNIMGLKARKKVIQEFSLAIMIQQYDRFFGLL